MAEAASARAETGKKDSDRIASTTKVASKTRRVMLNEESFGLMLRLTANNL